MSASVIATLNSIEPAATSSRGELPELVAAAQGVLHQAQQLFLPLTDAKYSEVVPAPYRASIGQHYRHVLEHFQCLIRGSAAGEVNYDARERNPRIEQEVSYANRATEEVLRAVRGWTAGTLDAPCRTVSSVGYGSEASQITSNLGRELSYCVGHAIHHYAIVRLLCSQLGVDVAPTFGYAPSTLNYKSSLSTE